MKSLNTQLKKYVRTLKHVRIERPYPEDQYMHGFIHGISKTLLVMQKFHDFYNEGYALIRISDIIGFRSNKYERFFDKMFKKEGLLK